MSGAQKRKNGSHSMARAAEGLASLKHRASNVPGVEFSQSRMPLTYELTVPEGAVPGYAFGSFGRFDDHSEHDNFPPLVPDDAKQDPMDSFGAMDGFRRDAFRGAPSEQRSASSRSGSNSNGILGNSAVVRGTESGMGSFDWNADLAQAKHDGMGGKQDFGSGQQDFASGKQDFLAGKRDFLAGKQDFMSGKQDFMSGKHDVASANMWNMAAMNAVGSMNAVGAMNTINAVKAMHAMNAVNTMNSVGGVNAAAGMQHMNGMNNVQQNINRMTMANMIMAANNANEMQTAHAGAKVQMVEMLKRTALEVTAAINLFRSTLRKLLQSRPHNSTKASLADVCKRTSTIGKELEGLSAALEQLIAQTQACASTGDRHFGSRPATARSELNATQKNTTAEGNNAIATLAPIIPRKEGNGQHKITLKVADFLVFCVGRERFEAIKPYQAVSKWKQSLDHALSDESPRDPATLAELANMERYFTERYRTMIIKAPLKGRKQVMEKCYHHLREMLNHNHLYHVAGCQDSHWLETSGRGFIAMALWDPLVVELFGSQSAGDTLLWHLRQECLVGGSFAPGHMKALACSLDKRIVLIPTDEDQFISGTPHVRVFTPFANRDRIESIRSFDCLRETQRINDIHISSQDAVFVGINHGSEYGMSVCVQRSVSYFLREKRMHYLQRYTQLRNYKDWAVVSGIFGPAADDGGAPTLISKQWTNNAFQDLPFGPAAVLKMALSKVRTNPESVLFLLHGFGIYADGTREGASLIGLRQYEDLADFALRYVKRWQAAVEQLPGWVDFEASFRSRITDFADHDGSQNPEKKKKNEEALRSMLGGFVQRFADGATAPPREKRSKGPSLSTSSNTQDRKRSMESGDDRRKKQRIERPLASKADAKVIEDGYVQVERLEQANKWYLACNSVNLIKKDYPDRMSLLNTLLAELDFLPHQVALSMVLVRTAIQVHLDVEKGLGLDKSICDHLVQNKKKLLFLKDRGDNKEQKKRQEIYDSICVSKDEQLAAEKTSASDRNSTTRAQTSAPREAMLVPDERDAAKAVVGGTDSDDGSVQSITPRAPNSSTGQSVGKPNPIQTGDLSVEEAVTEEPLRGSNGGEVSEEQEASKKIARCDAVDGELTLEEILDQVLKDAISMLSTG